MTEHDARYAVDLCEAFHELPKVRKALSDKPGEFHDAIHLELQAAEVVNGVSQCSSHYFNVSPALGRKILDAADKMIRNELKRLKVTPSRDSVSRPDRTST
jgi:hypothetical protein